MLFQEEIDYNSNNIIDCSPTKEELERYELRKRKELEAKNEKGKKRVRGIFFKKADIKINEKDILKINQRSRSKKWASHLNETGIIYGEIFN